MKIFRLFTFIGLLLGSMQSYGSLHEAAMDGAHGRVMRLLAQGADIHARDHRYGRTPLHWAADSGHTEVVKLLIERGADVNAQDDFQQTPLHRAALVGFIEVAKLLIARGADIHIRDNMGKTPLDWLCHPFRDSMDRPKYLKIKKICEEFKEMLYQEEQRPLRELWEMETSEYENYWQWIPDEIVAEVFDLRRAEK